MIVLLHSIYLGILCIYDRFLKVHTVDKATQSGNSIETVDVLNSNFQFPTEDLSRSFRSKSFLVDKQTQPTQKESTKKKLDLTEIVTDGMAGRGDGFRCKVGRGYMKQPPDPPSANQQAGAGASSDEQPAVRRGFGRGFASASPSIIQSGLARGRGRHRGSGLQSRGRGVFPRPSADPTPPFPSASSSCLTSPLGVDQGRGQRVDPSAGNLQQPSGPNQPTKLHNSPVQTLESKSGVRASVERTHSQGSEFSFAQGSDLDSVVACLQTLEPLWLCEKKDALPEKEKQSTSVKRLHQCFQTVKNPWNAVLHLTRTAKDYVTAKPSCLAYFCIRTFAKWCTSDAKREDQGRHLLTADLKRLAFCTATGKHITIFDAVASAFQLDGSDKEQFLDDIHRMVAEDRMKDACHVISRLGLQQHFTLEEMVIPLFLQDKINMVESYLAGRPELQRRFLSFLDKLCDQQFDLRGYISDVEVKGIRADKMHKKTISKLATRLLKLYDIPTDVCPNITNTRALGGLRYLMHKRFIEMGMGHGSWRELVEENVRSNTLLQEELIVQLVCYGENSEALHWAQLFHLPDDKLPPVIQDLRQGTATLEGQGHSEEWASWLPQEPGEDWDSPACTGSAGMGAAQFHSLSLHDGQVSVVETTDQLEDFYAEIGKPGCVIGFDSEWRPGFVGRPERIALLQVATANHVYLLDALCLRDVLDDDAWGRLARALFCDENNLTLGYGLATDLRILLKSFPSMKDAMHEMKRVVDIERLAKQVLQCDPRSADKDATEAAEDLSDEASGDGADNPDSRVGPDGWGGGAGVQQGLSQLVQTCLGKPLDKSEQMSDWERRPLRPQQITYAALDAFVLLELYEVMKTAAQKADRPIDLEPQLSSKWLKPSKKEQRRAKATRKAQKASVSRPPPKQRQCPPQSVLDFRVVVDSSLVGLGYQLRMCGVDVRILEDGVPHSDIIQISLKDDRIALSTGTPFPQIEASLGEGRCYEVRSQGARDQVLEVFKAFNIYLTADDIFSRCQICNGNKYINVSRERMQQLQQQAARLSSQQSAAGHEDSSVAAELAQEGIDYNNVTLHGSGVCVQACSVPLQTLEKMEEFYICATCGKVFWHGSHYDRICDQFEYVLSACAPPESSNASFKEMASVSNTGKGDMHPAVVPAATLSTSRERSCPWSTPTTSNFPAAEISGETRSESRVATEELGASVKWVGGVDTDSDDSIDGFYFD